MGSATEDKSIFDFLIVGGGSAGCVMASRLSEDPAIKVCLIEAGPIDKNPLIHIPLGMLWLMHSKVLNWRFYTDGEPHLAGRRLFWPRGRMLGGSGSSNAMLYTRGHSSDYDAWAALGNRGWSYAEVLPYFRRAENNEAGETPYHGVGGPMNVAVQRDPNVLSRTFLKAAEQCGIPFNADFNGENQEGAGLFSVTQKNGRRWSQARGYLQPALGRSNLTVLTGAHVTRLLIEQGRAVGVEYLVGNNRTACAKASREVILSAGAVQSPQLLMLSGIGDTKELQRAGIATLHHLPGVGKNLQDHLDVLVVQAAKRPVSAGLTLRNAARAIFELQKYFFKGRGMLTMTGAEGCAFLKSSPEESIPDIQFHFNPVRLSNHGLDLKFLFGEGYSLHVCDLRPKSRGHIRLASKDPLAHPLIQPNYLSEPEDLERIVRGVKVARRVLAASAFDSFRGREIRPGPDAQTDEEIKSFVRAYAETIYHPVGTCKMGSDAMAVVDDQLRVHGIAGLRVVDASIMPLLVGGNTNAPTVMIAEKAFDLIRQSTGQFGVIHGQAAG